MIYQPEKIKPITISRIIQEIEVEKYLQSIKENYIKESPQEIKNITVGERYDNPDINQYICQEYLKSNPERLGEFQFYTKRYELYQKTEENIIYYALIDGKYIILSYDVRPLTIGNLKGVESLSVIQSRIGDRSSWQFIARHFVFGYILKEYDFILSDKKHTSLGKTFWKGLFIESLNKFKCYVYNPKDNNLIVLTDVNQFETYYEKQYENFKFIISNKEFSNVPIPGG